jgi:hypothetical protein
VKQSDFDVETKALSVALEQRLTTEGAKVAFKIYKSSDQLLEWLNYLLASEVTGKCDDFLDGLRASIVETVGCGAAGIIRPAIFSMRAQIDIVFSWLYFKDHPVEWAKVEDSGEGFVLKSSVLEYLKLYIPHYEPRFALLLAKKTRKEADPYKLLSAHVHAQGVDVLPTHGNLETLIGPLNKSIELADLQAEVTEYISDVLLSCFGSKWASLPQKISNVARLRLGNDKIASVFS